MLRKFNWRENLGDLDGNTSLHFSAAIGKHNLLFNSVTLGCDVNSVNRMGWTPLMQAARNGHTQCVKTLIKFGADILHTNEFGINSLSLAVASQNLETVHVLLNVINEKKLIFSSKNYISPVVFAVLFNNLEIIKSLYEKSYNLNSSIYLGDLYPIDIAYILKSEKIIKYFKKRNIIPIKMALNTPSSPVFNFLSPYPNPKSFKKQRRSSNFKELPALRSPNVSPIPLKQDWLHTSYESNSPYSDNSYNILNSRISPVSLKFSSSSNDSFNQLLHPPSFGNTKVKCGSVPNIPTTDTFDDVFISDKYETKENFSNNNEFVKMLRKNSLDSCISLFKKHEIDLDIFLTLTKADLEEIGIDWNKRKDVLNLIYKYNKNSVRK